MSRVEPSISVKRKVTVPTGSFARIPRDHPPGNDPRLVATARHFGCSRRVTSRHRGSVPVAGPPLRWSGSGMAVVTNEQANPTPSKTNQRTTYSNTPLPFSRWRRFPQDRRVTFWPAVILAIDQGTTGTACLVVDEALRPIGRGYRALEQHFPQPGWVEHDPDEIWATVEGSAADALAAAGVRAHELSAIGITNQRETTLVWQRRSGRPVHRAIVWQDRRTAARCAQLPADLIRERTGLVPDPYFSATKLEWILGRTDIPQRELVFGTVDTWLVWKLTGGAAHITDVTNASRTMLLDLASGEWDEELLELFGVEQSVLPSIVDSSGIVAEASLVAAGVPIAG